MITSANSDKTTAFVCLSGDQSELPTDVANGSKVFFMDTGKTLYFDAENEEWIDPTENP